MSRHNEETRAIDNLVGAKIKELRMSQGLSRVQFAKKIDCSYQQLSKYESGNNRVSIGRMYIIARALNKSLMYFVEGKQPHMPTEHQRLGLEVSRNFAKIESPATRITINNLVRELSQ